MWSLCHPTYFPNIEQWVVWKGYPPMFDIDSNYQKQTYRNRLYLLGANGIQRLSIPIKHNKTITKLKYREVEIDNSIQWQNNHWNTIRSAYGKSVFFEHYKYLFECFFKKKYRYLHRFNFESISLVSKCLGIDIKEEIYTEDKSAKPMLDIRALATAKREYTTPWQPYIQVFADRYKFQGDLSIVDLLFNVGNYSQHYLSYHLNAFNL